MDVYVGKRIKWPHEFVLAGNTKDRVSYNRLTLYSGWLVSVGP